MQRPVHPSFGRIKTVVDGYKYGWMGGGRVKQRRSKKSSKTIDIDSYALDVHVKYSKWCHMCVFVVHFRSSDTF